MIGEIIKIHPVKIGKNKEPYIRLDFKMEDGSWAKTDICPNYRNFGKCWKWAIRIGPGTRLKDLKMKNESTVDADSDCSIIPEPLTK